MPDIPDLFYILDSIFEDCKNDMKTVTDRGSHTVNLRFSNYIDDSAAARD